jgi:YD repeat-containing protein
VKDELIRSLTLHDPASGVRHRFVEYQYDAAGDLIAVLDTLGNPYRFAYDQHHLIRHTDRNGLSFHYAFDTSAETWRVVHSWGDGGLYDYRFQYLKKLNETRLTDSLGSVWIVKFDEHGLPISEIDPLGGIARYEYDEVGRTTAVVDLDGHRTEYEYDERGNLLKLTRPDGHTIVSTFDALNKATSITDPNGAVWRQEWDGRGLLARQISPLGAVSCYEYDALGQLSGFTNPRGACTAITFDASGNLKRLTDALGHPTEFVYDWFGNITGKTDALGQRSRYVYDGKGRLTKAVLPSGAAVECAYDAEDNVIRYIDENKSETRLEYCGLGQIRRRLQPDGHSVEYLYDPEERLIGVKNQRGELYELRRDPLGRIVEEIDYWGQGRRYAYTASGFLKESTDPLGCRISYETDPLGRILKKVLPDPRNCDADQAETFSYDGNGNIIACENAAIHVERVFDPEGRMVEERQGNECVVGNTYDLNGHRTSRETRIEVGGLSYTYTVLYRYDVLDQASEVEVQGHIPLRFSRNALGQITDEVLSASLQRRIAYNSDGYLTAQQMFAAERPVCEQRYIYDRAGNSSKSAILPWASTGILTIPSGAWSTT